MQEEGTRVKLLPLSAGISELLSLTGSQVTQRRSLGEQGTEPKQVKQDREGREGQTRNPDRERFWRGVLHPNRI